MKEIYKIEGADYYNPPKDYTYYETYPMFQDKLLEFKSLLIEQVKNLESATYYKFGDGDYFFLKKDPKGSAKPGNRALSKKYWRINHKEFVKGSKLNDYYFCEIVNQNKKYFNELFESNFDFPGEFVYGLTANKWFFKNFQGKIGLIGANQKLNLIKELLRYEEYQEYLGITGFTDYIAIPQKFACDNINETRNIVKKQLVNSKADLFLMGVGHVKSGLNYLLSDYKKAIYLDIGSGIDAIAGIIDKERPYFSSWDNFRLKEEEMYKEIDFLQFNFDGSEKILN